SPGLPPSPARLPCSGSRPEAGAGGGLRREVSIGKPLSCRYEGHRIEASACGRAQKPWNGPLSQTTVKQPGDKPSEIVAVIRRILAENGREYTWYYALAVLCLIAVAATTAFTAWIMRDVIDEIFYRQRGDLIVLICLAIMAAFVIRGVATYGQSVI